MKALITQRESLDQHSVRIDVLESTYIHFFENIGVSLRPVSNYHKNIVSLFEETQYDLIILTGGGAVEVKFYDKPHTEIIQCYRDQTEKKIISEAIQRKIPILAICRGMQLVNGLYGGRISELTSLKVPRKIGHDHPIIIGDELVNVNNYHNSGIFEYQLGANLIIIAKDEVNNVVEGFYHKKDQILGIQWHPERKFSTIESYQKSENLVRRFIQSGGMLNERYHISRRSRYET